VTNLSTVLSGLPGQVESHYYLAGHTQCTYEPPSEPYSAAGLASSCLEPEAPPHQKRRKPVSMEVPSTQTKPSKEVEAPHQHTQHLSGEGFFCPVRPKWLPEPDANFSCNCCRGGSTGSSCADEGHGWQACLNGIHSWMMFIESIIDSDKKRCEMMTRSRQCQWQNQSESRAAAGKLRIQHSHPLCTHTPSSSSDHPFKSEHRPKPVVPLKAAPANKLA
jgi:hypothetical protein